MKKINLLIILCIFSFLIIGCEKKEDLINFNVNEKFNIENIEKKDDIYYLKIKSEDDISIYLKDLRNKYPNQQIKLNIQQFHEDAKNTDFTLNNLKIFIAEVDCNLSNNKYKIKRYIDLPNIENSEILGEFSNEKVETIGDKTSIYITINNIENLSTLVAQLKTYLSIVKEENKLDKSIEIIVNHEYIYNGDNYLIQEKTSEF